MSERPKYDFEDDINDDPRKPTPFSVFVDLGRAIVHLEKAEPALKEILPRASVKGIVKSIEKIKDRLDA